MYVAAHLLYRDGAKVPGRPRPLVGQLYTDSRQRCPVMYLHDLQWRENAPNNYPPLAILWQPVLVRLGHSDLLLRGYEACTRGRTRWWAAQRWLCDVLDAQSAARYFDHEKPKGALPSSLPPAPPPLNPEDPFNW